MTDSGREVKQGEEADDEDPPLLRLGPPRHVPPRRFTDALPFAGSGSHRNSRHVTVIAHVTGWHLIEFTLSLSFFW